MEVDEAVRRLTFIKYLSNLGIDQARKPEPFCWTAVLTLHDSMELFLELALEFHGSGKKLKDMGIMQYWDELSSILKSKGKNELSQRISMEKLNEARVAFKHHGTPPSKIAIDGFKNCASNFFEENTKLVFDVRFDDLSMLELVRCQDAKNCLKEAEELAKQNKTEEALDRVAVALEVLIDDYEERKTDQFGRSPFFFGRGMTFLGSFFIGAEGRLGNFIDATKESIEALQTAVKILSLSLDYRRYARFRLLTPHVEAMPDGKYDVIRRNRGSKGAPSIEDVNFCMDFVIESALALQEFDYEISNTPEQG